MHRFAGRIAQMQDLHIRITCVVSIHALISQYHGPPKGNIDPRFILTSTRTATFLSSFAHLIAISRHLFITRNRRLRAESTKASRAHGSWASAFTQQILGAEPIFRFWGLGALSPFLGRFPGRLNHTANGKDSAGNWHNICWSGSTCEVSVTTCMWAHQDEDKISILHELCHDPTMGTFSWATICSSGTLH